METLTLILAAFVICLGLFSKGFAKVILFVLVLFALRECGEMSFKDEVADQRAYCEGLQQQLYPDYRGMKKECGK